MDEPLSNLDAKLRGQMRTEIARLQRRLGITTVYVTHDQTEAMTLGDRVAVLRRGVLQQLATPRELYTNPGNLFVAGFIGSPPMNFLPAKVEEDGAVSIGGAPAFRPQPAPASLAGYRGKAVTIGVRPEDLDLAPGGGGRVAARLEVREPLGNETLLYWTTEAGPLVSRLSGGPAPEPGAAASLHFDFEKLRWFDPQSERALETNGAG